MARGGPRCNGAHRASRNRLSCGRPLDNGAKSVQGQPGDRQGSALPPWYRYCRASTAATMNPDYGARTEMVRLSADLVCPLKWKLR